MVEWSRGHTISSNIAPSTATASVVHNAQFAAAYGGMHLFKVNSASFFGGVGRFEMVWFK